MSHSGGNHHVQKSTCIACKFFLTCTIVEHLIANHCDPLGLRIYSTLLALGRRLLSRRLLGLVLHTGPFLGVRALSLVLVRLLLRQDCPAWFHVWLLEAYMHVAFRSAAYRSSWPEFPARLPHRPLVFSTACTCTLACCIMCPLLAIAQSSALSQDDIDLLFQPELSKNKPHK